MGSEGKIRTPDKLDIDEETEKRQVDVEIKRRKREVYETLHYSSFA